MKTFVTTAIDAFKHSEIIQNVATLSIGSIVSQIIPVVMSLILSRLYTPDDYGNFGVFINYAGILTVVVSARYEYAIIRPKRNTDALNLFALSGIIAVTVCSFLTFFLLLADWCGWEAVCRIPGRYLLPLYGIIAAALQILSCYSNRQEQYKSLTLASVTRSLSQALSRVLFGIFRYGGGLIAGSVIGVLGGTALLASKTRPVSYLRKCLSWRRMKELARIYVNFPKYQLYSGLLNALSTNLPVILLASFYSKESIGYFSMSISLLYLPVTLVGNALGQVFYKKASVWEPAQTAVLASRILYFNCFLGLAIFLVLLTGGESLFRFLLGEKWGTVGLYSIYLCPWLISVLCFSPLSWIFDARDKQKIEMWLNAGMFAIRTLVILLSSYFLQSVDMTILLFGLSGMLLWGVEGYFIYRVTGLEIAFTRKVILTIFLILLLIIWIIRIWSTFH